MRNVQKNSYEISDLSYIHRMVFFDDAEIIKTSIRGGKLECVVSNIKTNSIPLEENIMAYSAYLGREITDKEIEYIVYVDEFGNQMAIATHTSIEKFAISQGLKIEYSGEIATEGYYKVTCTVSDGVRTVTKIGENTAFALKRDDERQRNFSWREFPLTKAYNMALDRAVLAFYSIEGRVYSDTELDRSAFKRAEPAPAPKKKRKAISEDSVSAEELPTEEVKEEPKAKPVAEEPVPEKPATEAVAEAKPEEAAETPAPAEKTIAEATVDIENNPAVMEAFDAINREDLDSEYEEEEAVAESEEVSEEVSEEAAEEAPVEEPKEEAVAEEDKRTDEAIKKYVETSERYQEEDLHIVSTDYLDAVMNFGRHKGSGRTLRSLFYDDDEYILWMTKRMTDNESINAVRKTFGIE